MEFLSLRLASRVNICGPQKSTEYEEWAKSWELWHWTSWTMVETETIDHDETTATTRLGFDTKYWLHRRSYAECVSSHEIQKAYRKSLK